MPNIKDYFQGKPKKTPRLDRLSPKYNKPLVDYSSSEEEEEEEEYSSSEKEEEEPEKPSKKRKRIQHKAIGYEKLREGLQVLGTQFKITKNGMSVEATMNDVIELMKLDDAVDTAYNPPKDIKLHPLCNKHNHTQFTKTNKPNCLCSKEDLRYLYYFKIPVDGKTKKFTDFIVGSNCIIQLIGDKDIPKYIRDSLRDIHYEMVDSMYYKCIRCAGQNGKVGINGDTRTWQRRQYCESCSVIYTKIRNKLIRANEKNDYQEKQKWNNVKRNFNDISVILPLI